MSAEANAVSRQGMLFGDPLEGLDTDEMGYRGPVACSAAGIVSSTTGLAPAFSSRLSALHAVLAPSASIPSVTSSF